MRWYKMVFKNHKIFAKKIKKRFTVRVMPLKYVIICYLPTIILIRWYKMVFKSHKIFAKKNKKTLYNGIRCSYYHDIISIGKEGL